MDGPEIQAQHDDVGRLWPVAKRLLTPIFKGLWRIKVEGMEHVPEHGGAIFCPNHTSVIDSFFLPVVLPRQIKFVGKSEYMDSWKTKHLFPALGMIPIDRGGGSAAERALDTAARVLDDGGYFGIYPEGTRARDGRLHRGHTGPARLALRTGCPIVPVGLIGTRDVQPPDAKVPKPFKTVHVRFGRPIDPTRYTERSEDRLVLRQIIDEVMYEIRELSGQEYVDEYATKSKAAAPAPQPEATDVVDLEAGAPVSTNGHTEPEDQPEHYGEGGAPSRRSSAEALARWG